jgi:hypothetical protein
VDEIAADRLAELIERFPARREYFQSGIDRPSGLPYPEDDVAELVGRKYRTTICPGCETGTG